ncbi:hypothetical protein An02g01910 [Aspergillus niger]|uniref:Uncharacterized protein n=2 Tax=Aspergillus niger TaxID=5061 RepID=A2QC12_ASPNC|nr:hypothetical protein An02g01910 [Aspergillus niger]CAK37493.1 hypothetical protein An02g01910 [Aspergillus niger]
MSKTRVETKEKQRKHVPGNFIGSQKNLSLWHPAQATRQPPVSDARHLVKEKLIVEVCRQHPEA